MNLYFKSALATLLASAACAVLAADGTLGATSVGSFTNSFNSAATAPTVQVQILNLRDSEMTPYSGPVWTASSPSQLGATDNFCVVHSGGGAVLLTFVNSNGGTANSFYAAATGEPNLEYHLSVATVNTAAYSPQANLISVSQNTFEVPAGTTVANSANCGNGNMKKSIVRAGTTAPLDAGTAVWRDVVTVTASPV